MSTNNEKEKEIKKEEQPDLKNPPDVTTLDGDDGDGEDTGPLPPVPPPPPPKPGN